MVVAHVYEAAPPKKRASAVKYARKRFEENMSRPLYELGMNLSEASYGNVQANARLKESVATPDFPNLFNQLTAYGMLGQYAELPSTWPAYADRVTVSDFRAQRLMEWDDDWSQMPEQNGGFPRNSHALARIPELTEYPTFSLTEAERSYYVAKYGARFPFSFEVFRNDEFQIIQDLPSRMALRANQTEDIAATSVLASPTGPAAPFFNTDQDFGPHVPPGNYVPGNPELSIDAIRTAIENITMRRVNGRMVTVQHFALVVPPSLEFRARELTTDSQFLTVEPRGDGEVRYNTTNVVAGRFTVVVNQFLPLVDQSDNSVNTWYLVPMGGTDGTRRAIVMAFLTGEEVPDLRVNSDTGSAIGGGAIDPMRGSFSHDDVQFRVRHILGATGLDNAPVAVSLGTNEDS